MLRVSYTEFFFSYWFGASHSGFDKDSSLQLSVSGCRIVNVYGLLTTSWSLHLQDQAVQEGPLFLECLTLKLGSLWYFEISIKICHYFFVLFCLPYFTIIYLIFVLICSDYRHLRHAFVLMKLLFSLLVVLHAAISNEGIYVLQDVFV